jgi:hypothetical protein
MKTGFAGKHNLIPTCLFKKNSIHLQQQKPGKNEVDKTDELYAFWVSAA